jgi:hypothetical protein
MNKKTLFLILFSAVLFGFILFWLYRQTMFSKEILRLEILGPENAKAGDEIEYTIKYKNNGNFVLEQPKLDFLLPDNSLTEEGKMRISHDLKDIYPGGEDLVKVKARLLGKEGDLKTARATLSYTPRNLSARYESDTSFTTKIDSVPITLDFDLPTKAEKGKNLQFSINYFSNIDYPLENLSLKVQLPSGFQFESSQPTSLDNSEWKLKTLNKAQGGRVTITGKVSGDQNQNITFSTQLGMRQNGTFVVIKEKTQDVQVIQPLLYISQQVNGSNSYVASPGETLHYQIFFRNIGSSPFDDLFAVVKLDGAALDMSSIQAAYGQVQSNDNLIVWDHGQAPQLRRLNSQEEANIDFYVKVRNDWNVNSSDSGGRVITDDVNISQITQNFSIKVNSGLVLSQRGYYKNSEIDNSGSIPPVVGQNTQYTITWDVKNYFSDEKNVKVKAKLPVNVSLTGKIIPTDESSHFSFDSVSREIVWSAGDIPAGAGVKGDPYSISFQISLKPTSSQRGYIAPLIGEAQISGENQFTNTTITAKDGAIDASLPDDSGNSGGGVVK